MRSTSLSAAIPDSRYAADARLKLDLIKDHLAGKEMEVGRFYERSGQWLAATYRFRNVVDQYQTTSHTPEALERLVECYLALGIPDEAWKASAVLGKNYPGTYWYRQSLRLLHSEQNRPACGRIGRSRASRTAEVRGSKGERLPQGQKPTAVIWHARAQAAEAVPREPRMLRQLSIRNIVLVEQLELEFERGLGVLTGETGAGKSILLDALGPRAGRPGRCRPGPLRRRNRRSVSAEIELPRDHSVVRCSASRESSSSRASR